MEEPWLGVLVAERYVSSPLGAASVARLGGLLVCVVVSPLVVASLACGPPEVVRTVPVEVAMTTVAPTLPSPPPHRGALEVSAGGEAQSVLATTGSGPRDLSLYLRPSTGQLLVGGRFSRFVGARLLGELGLGIDAIEGYGRALLGAGMPGRLGGALVIGYTSEASVVSGTLSLEAGIEVVGIQRLLHVETRTCGGGLFAPCTPWTFARFGGEAGTDILPYGRAVGTLGVSIVHWLRWFLQAGIVTTPKLGGVPTAVAYSFDAVFGVSAA